MRANNGLRLRSVESRALALKSAPAPGAALGESLPALRPQFPSVIRPLDSGSPHTPEDTDVLCPRAHHSSNSAPFLSLQHAKSEILPKYLKVTIRQSSVYVIRIPRLQDKGQSLKVGHWQVGVFLSDV